MLTLLIVALVSAAAGYGFRGLINKGIKTVGKDANSVSLTAKLDAAKVKTDAIADAVEAQKTVVADLHDAVNDIHKAL